MTKCEHAMTYRNNPALLRPDNDYFQLGNVDHTRHPVLSFDHYVLGLFAAAQHLYVVCSANGCFTFKTTEKNYISQFDSMIQEDYRFFNTMSGYAKIDNAGYNDYICHLLPHLIIQVTGECEYPASDFALVARILKLLV